jgi:F0F1-type ATP synthase membrane subunit c/vacuolar-type H+-ATPase subunit K
MEKALLALAAALAIGRRSCHGRAQSKIGSAGAGAVRRNQSDRHHLHPAGHS